MIDDHEPLVIEEFNGFFDRGDNEAVPPDHFISAINIKYSESRFDTRFGIDVYNSPVSIAPDNVLRVHNYTMQNQQSQLILRTGGHIDHVVSSTVIHTDILVIAAMTDFNVVSIAGRAYITPFFTDTDGYEKGLQNNFLYVYKGDGTAARKAAGDPPSGTITVSDDGAGNGTDAGLHLFGVVFESDTGWLSAPAAFASHTTIANTNLDFSTIPVSAQSHITKRHIVATKRILNFNGDLDGYQYFFIPDATINDNVTTTLANISFFDLDLLDDASHLLDQFTEIPAGVGLTTYHGRLVLTTTFTDISVAYASAPGEPEAIDQVDGVMIVPLDGKPLTNCQEYRDILYLFKITKTVGYSDNEDVPSTWKPFDVDEAVGAPVHGVATVLDSGGVGVDYLLIGDYSGIMLFNGSYGEPELSYKIRNFWFDLDRTQFREIELVNDSVSKIVYCVLPDNTLLIGDYNNGRNAKDIRWAIWTFDIPITTIELVNTSTLMLGATVNASSQSGLYKVVVNKTNDTLYNTSNVTANVKIPNPTARSGYSAVSEDEAIIHINMIRVRAFGTGNLRPTLFSLDDVLSSVLVPLPMASTTERHLTRKANFQTDRVSLQLQTTAIDEVMHINRIIMFASEVFAEYPQ
jgi:hypothetical protein